MLHIISTNAPDSLNYCQQCLQEGDSILFIDEGVYLLMQNKLAQSTPITDYYALRDAVAARGIERHVPKYINLVDYDKFVELTEIYPTNQMW